MLSATPARQFGQQLTNYDTTQPPPVGSLPQRKNLIPIKLILDHLDTVQANSKFYNPYTFDPTQQDYQRDVRLAVRDELPSEIDAADVGENWYAYLYMTELTWPSLFFGAWAAFEPDVRNTTCKIHLAHHSLPLGEGSTLSIVQRRACSQKIPHR